MIDPRVLVFTRSRLPKALFDSSRGVMASMSSWEEEDREVSEKREEGALLPLLDAVWPSVVLIVLSMEEV